VTIYLGPLELGLIAFAYLCAGEAWVQHRIVNEKQSIGVFRHAAMVLGCGLVLHWRCARWYWRLGKGLLARRRG